MAKALAGKMLRHIALMDEDDKNMVINLYKMKSGHTPGNLANLQEIQRKYKLGEPEPVGEPPLPSAVVGTEDEVEEEDEKPQRKSKRSFHNLK